MTVYNAGNIYLEDLAGGTSDQIHIYAQTDNIADGAITDTKLASDGILSRLDEITDYTYDPEFVRKTIDMDDQTIVDSTTRVLSKPFSPSAGEMFSTGEGYTFRVIYLNRTTQQYIALYGWGNSYTFAQPNPNYDYYIQVRKGDGSTDIIPGDVMFTTDVVDFRRYVPAGYDDLQNETDQLGEITDDLTTFNNHDQYSLNIVHGGKEDMIWSWWYYPQVVSFERVRSKIYWGFTTADGYTGIAEYDLRSKEIRKNYLKKSEVDDHNGLALYVADNGTIVCAYAGGHNTDRAMHVRVSTVPECIESFDDAVTVPSGGTTTYGQFIYHSGTLYLFYRTNNTDWAYVYSEDMGRTWSAETVLITSSLQYYCMFRETTTDGLVRICMYSNPGSSDSNIRMGFLNLSSGTLYNADGTTALGTGGIAHTSFDVIIPTETDKTQRMFDVAITEPSRPLVLYAPFATYNDSVYKVYDAGVSHEIVSGGEAFWYPKYQNGCSWIGDSRIVVSRGYSGSDRVELYSYERGSVALVKTVYTEVKGNIPIRNVRPIADINSEAFIWHRGYYNPNVFTDYNTDALIYIIGDDDIV